MRTIIGAYCTSALQKVLSLATFCYTFVRKNVTGLSNDVLLMFNKNFMSTASSLCEILYTEKASGTLWLILMKSAVVHSQNLWHWRTFSRSRYTTEWLLCTVNMRHHMPLSIAEQLSFIKGEGALKMSPGRDVRLKKLSCCWKYCTEKSSYQCAVDSWHCGHKYWFH